MPSAVFVSYRAARPDGDGGNHRSYQILLDLQATFGANQVRMVSIEDWTTAQRSGPASDVNGTGPLRDMARRVRHRLARMTENPYKLLSREGWSHRARFGTRGVLSHEFVAHMLASIGQIDAFDTCVVDHPILDHVRTMANMHGVPCVIASHNIESLDVGRLRLNSALSAHTAAIDLANELRALRAYEQRFAISKVEASLLTGVGLSCWYYPYLPTGEVREHFSRIGRRRDRTRPDESLFILMGTANHAPTRRSLEWFTQHARECGLPKGARVVVFGDKVEDLAGDGPPVAGLDVRGRISNEALSDLLIRATAALVPQRMGFGALTRIPELACAGVPVIMFPHASYALDPPPGVHVLQDDSWSTLMEGMRAAMQYQTVVDPRAYAAWESVQLRPLGRALQGLLASQ